MLSKPFMTVPHSYVESKALDYLLGVKNIMVVARCWGGKSKDMNKERLVNSY